MAHPMPVPPATPMPASVATTVMFETREMVELRQKLNDLGIDQTVQLPQICVVGDQSTGKSSLVEALTAIKVPRAAGMCTQCPLEINMLRHENTSEPWKCKVSLETKYEFVPSAVNKAPTKNHPMGPWTVLPNAIIQLFAETTVKGEVCDLIQQAQLAILNPDKDPKGYLHRSAGSRPTYTIKFSPNAVRLDITQSEIPSLSFIDLPGVITNVDKREDAYLVRLVKALATSYIKQPRSILLTLLPMTNDIANSTALSILQDLGAGTRALGVLTKPDRVQNEESLTQFREILTGLNGPVLKHGYHVVMMDPDVTLSHAEAIQAEKVFFEKREPWCSMDDLLRKRFGVEKLSRTLSLLLQEETRRTLPTTQTLIQNRLNHIEERLVEIPAPADAVALPTVLFTMVKDFEKCMEKMFEGGGGTVHFRKSWDRLAGDFRKTLKSSFPRANMSTEDEIMQSNKADAMIKRKEAAASPLPKRSGAADRCEISSDDDSTPRNVKADNKSAISQPVRPVHHYQFTLKQIRDINQDHAAGGLPRNVFPMALNEMQKMSVSQWEVPLEKFVTSTTNLIAESVETHANIAFGSYLDMPLFQVIAIFIKNWLKDACMKQLNKSIVVCSTEQEKPYTLEAATLTSESNKILAMLRERRVNFRIELETKKQQAEGKTGGAKGKNKLTVFDKDTLSPDDWDTEISMLAGIYARLFHWCGNNLSTELMGHLGPMKTEQQIQITEWMSENPERLRERHELLRERDRLREARSLIKEALGSSGMNGNGHGKRKAGVVGDDVDMEEPVMCTPFKKSRVGNGVISSMEGADEMDAE